MKKTVNVAIGGYSFTINEDAYNAMDEYLERSEAAIQKTGGNTNVLDELELRIADMLRSELGGRQVVDLAMVQKITGQLGYPAGYEEPGETSDEVKDEKAVRRLYRDPDGKKIAGVCSGLGIFFGIDATIFRIAFLLALFFGTAGFWIYVVIWIAAPEAKTAAEKCELRGIPANAENIRKFTE